MEFRISDTFTGSLSRLETDEQKLAKTTAFDLQMNPANPGHQFHKLDRAKDPNFWSVRVSSDVRLIVHRTDSSLMLCYVAHHDDAYRWAERRRLETHPKTGAAQLVEIREIVREVEVQHFVDIEGTPALPVAAPPQPKPILFHSISSEELLAYGVPDSWIEEIRTVDEDGLLALADHLPAEAAEALLELATGGTPQIRELQPAGIDPFAHPDAQRRFRVIENIEELEAALDAPWEQWAIFLHPAQTDAVQRTYAGPARVAGSAGTGKTVVALHRAAHLLRVDADARVLLATFSPTLATQLRQKMFRLLSSDPRLGERLEVGDMTEIAKRLYEARFGRTRVLSNSQLDEIMRSVSGSIHEHKFSIRFLVTEWREVVDAWQLKTWEEYRDVRRLGRKTRLPEAQRVVLWSIFERVGQRISDEGLVSEASMLGLLTEHIRDRQSPPFQYAVVDEAQDVSVPQLKFLASLGSQLFFAGDLGQRIFQTPFSWLSLGVDVRGRSRSLKVNYRTSHQIRKQADRLLGNKVTDVDGNVEERRGTVSVFNGPLPEIKVAKSEAIESQVVAEWLRGLDLPQQQIGVIVRSDRELPRAYAAVEKAGLKWKLLTPAASGDADKVSVATMHLAKGMEFRAVAVMAIDDEIIPNQARIESVADESDLEEVYTTERHLLYVACTRARDFLLLSSGGDPSEFLEDFDLASGQFANH